MEPRLNRKFKIDNLCDIKNDQKLIATLAEALEDKQFMARYPSEDSKDNDDQLQQLNRFHSPLSDYMRELIWFRICPLNGKNAPFNSNLMEAIFRLADKNPRLKKAIQDILQDPSFSPHPLVGLLVPYKALYEKSLAYLKDIPNVDVADVLSNASLNHPSTLSTLARYNKTSEIETLLSDYEFKPEQHSEFFKFFNSAEMKIETIKFLHQKGIKVSRDLRITPNELYSTFRGYEEHAFAFGNTSLQKLIWLHEDINEIPQDAKNYAKRKEYLASLAKQSKLSKRKPIIRANKNLLSGFIYEGLSRHGLGIAQTLSEQDSKVKYSDLTYLQGLLVEAQSNCSDKKPEDGYTPEKAELYYIEAALADNPKAIIKLINRDLSKGPSEIKYAINWIMKYWEILKSDRENCLSLLLHDKDIIKNLINLIYNQDHNAKENYQPLWELILELRQYDPKKFGARLDINSCGELAELLNSHGEPLAAAKLYLDQYNLLKKIPSSSITSEAIEKNIVDCFITDFTVTKEIKFQDLFSTQSSEMTLLLMTLTKLATDDQYQSTLLIRNAVKRFTLRVIKYSLDHINNPEFEDNIQHFLNFIIQHQNKLQRKGLIDDATIKKIDETLPLAFNQRFEVYAEDTDLKSITMLLRPSVQAAHEVKFPDQSLLQAVGTELDRIHAATHDPKPDTPLGLKMLNMVERLKSFLQTILLSFSKKLSTSLEAKESVVAPSASAHLQYSLLSRTTSPSQPTSLEIDEEDASKPTPENLDASPQPGK